MDVNTLKQFADGGIVLILLAILGSVAWYILKVRDPHEARLEATIEKISTALQQIDANHPRSLALFEQQADHHRSEVKSKLDSISTALSVTQTALGNLSSKMDLLAAIRTSTGVLHGHPKE